MTDVPHEYRAGYRPSGRVNWLIFIPGFVATALFAIVMAWCLFWALQRGIYLILVAPLIASFPVIGVWYLVLTWSNCRNKRIAVVTSIAIALLLYLGSFQVGLAQMVGARNAHRIDLLPYYVQFRMKTDVARDAHRPNPKKGAIVRPDRVQQAFNWLFFGIELVTVLGMVVAVGHYCSSRAYCEACSRWMKSETLKLAPGVGMTLWDSVQDQRYDDVHALLGNTSRQSAVGCNLTVEHCPACAAEERPQVVYLSVKDVVTPGIPDPITAKIGSLFKPRWSAGLRGLVNQVELRPEEVGALAQSFPGLKGTIDTHPKLFADAQAVAREIGRVEETKQADGSQRFARIKAVDPDEAGKILTRPNAIIQTIVAIGSIFGGFLLALAPALILSSMQPKPPEWVLGIAVGWLFLGMVLNLAWILFYPTYFTSRFMLRQTRNAFEYRPSPAVDLNSPELVFVDIVPRINWGKQMMENATDIGFLELNKAKRELVFEGDRQRYWIPVESIFEIKHEFWAESVQHQLQSSPTLHHHVVIRAHTADGPWETWFSRRQDSLRMLTAKRRLADAKELELKIRQLVEPGV